MDFRQRLAQFTGPDMDFQKSRKMAFVTIGNNGKENQNPEIQIVPNVSAKDQIINGKNIDEESNLPYKCMVCPIRFKEISLAKLHFLCVHGNQDEKVTPKVQNERELVGNFTFVDTSEQSLTVHDKAMRARSEFLSETIPETSDRQSESNSIGNFSFVEPETQLAEMKKYLNIQENTPTNNLNNFQVFMRLKKVHM